MWVSVAAAFVNLNAAVFFLQQAKNRCLHKFIFEPVCFFFVSILNLFCEVTLFVLLYCRVVLLFFLSAFSAEYLVSFLVVVKNHFALRVTSVSCCVRTGIQITHRSRKKSNSSSIQTCLAEPSIVNGKFIAFFSHILNF